VQEFRDSVISAALFTRLTEIRVQDPDCAIRVAKTRERRVPLTRDGKLNILAADHPARRVTTVGANPLGMADRHDYLVRIMRVLMSSAVDGVMATMDIIEDLLILHDLFGKDGFLKDKLLIASLNRGGLAGTSWEMNDALTGASPETCAAWELDGAKILMRLCDDEPDSLRTMVATASAISETNALHIPMFLEPLPVVKTEKGYKVVKTAEALAKIVGVASALGDSSRYLWLKLPYCENYEVVARATTLPILLLGGESAGDPTAFLREVSAGMAAGANVRGALVGRNVLYPGDDDPLAVAEAVGGIVHQGWTVEDALAEANAVLRKREAEHAWR
jgi:DhnA family fructose-bisphosphate aldolase class Ia